jgi:cell division protein FtsB
VTAAPHVDDPDDLDRQQRRRLAVAYAATLLPLIAFGYLTWQAARLNEQVHDAQQTLEKANAGLAAVNSERAQAEQDLAKLKADLNTQRQATKHYRDMAGIKVRFYRESDRALVRSALIDEGFNVDASLGSSRLIDRDPNTLAYGSLVSEADLREIAAALVSKGFPLKRIAPAMTQPDPRLIQIYASTQSDRDCDVLTAEQVRTTPFRNREICGRR